MDSASQMVQNVLRSSLMKWIPRATPSPTGCKTTSSPPFSATSHGGGESLQDDVTRETHSASRPVPNRPEQTQRAPPLSKPSVHRCTPERTGAALIFPPVESEPAPERCLYMRRGARGFVRSAAAHPLCSVGRHAAAMTFLCIR